MPSEINSESAVYCFLDFDLNHHRQKLALAAAFVDSTDARYGFSSKDIRALGGSELSRVEDLIGTDHEWSSKVSSSNGIEIRAPNCGSRVVLKLYWDTAPLACENFATLCYNGSNLPTMAKEKKCKPAPIGESGKPLTYRDSIVHRVVPGFIMQGGDIIFGNGSGGESIYNGKKFKDERLGLTAKKHDRRGILSMGNSGKHSNSSQWFLTFQATPQCDGKHVIFGEVVSGWEVIDAVEQLGGKPDNGGSGSGEPMATITITDCGIWAPFWVPGAGWWYDKPDAESFTNVSPTFVTRPRVAVVAPNDSVRAKFSKALSGFCSVTLVVVKNGGEEDVITNRLRELLETFAIDVVVFAPACKLNQACLQLPASWQLDSAPIPWEQVMIETKPVDALSAVQTESWMAKLRTAWHLDGVTR